MKCKHFWQFCFMAWVLMGATVHAQELDSLSMPPMSEEPWPTYRKPMTLAVDETGFPPPGPPYSLFSPFEIFVRGGPSFVTGTGALDRAMRTGKTIEGGVRSFSFNADQTAAWTSEVGIDYTYNNIHTSEPLLARAAFVGVTRFGGLEELPGLSQYAFREMHRTNARLALGREWYFAGPNGLRYNFGLDVGGRIGQTSVKLFTVSRVIEGALVFDTFPDFEDGHTSGLNKGVFIGVNTGLLLPCHGFDITLGSRFEWGQEWFSITSVDDSVAQIKLLISVGLRF